MKGLKNKIVMAMAITCLGSSAYAQAPDVGDLIDDSKSSTEVTRGILDYKPKSLKLYGATKMEYDSNVYKSNDESLWNHHSREKYDAIWKNTVLVDYNFNTEEDHAMGLKYMGEFDFYHYNKDKELGMHDMGAFYQYDMDPDPISARVDFDYKFIRIGERSFMNTKDTEGLLKIKYNDLFGSDSHVDQKGEYRLKLSYNQYQDNYNNAQAETGLDTTVKYKHKFSFSKTKFPTFAKYVRGIDLGFEYKHSSPRSEDSRYDEYKFRPRVSFRNLPLKLTGKIEWVHYDRRYSFRTNDDGDEKRNDRRDDAKIGVSRRLNKYLTLNVDYMRGWRDSNVASKEYGQDLVSVGVSALF